MASPEYPEILSDAGEHVACLLESRGYAAEKASALAFEITEVLRKHWGGQEVYIPKAEHLELSQRDARAYEMFAAGHGWLELSREFGLSERRLRQIVQQARLARRQAAHQAELPLDFSPCHAL